MAPKKPGDGYQGQYRKAKVQSVWQSRRLKQNIIGRISIQFEEMDEVKP